MKTLVASLMLLASLCAYSASADEAVGSTISESAPRIWTGFYAGLSAGGFWNNTYDPASIDWSRLPASGSFNYSSGFAPAPQRGVAWNNGVGFVGGGQLGYSWQLTDKIVVGVETDVQGFAGGRGNSSTGGLTTAPFGNGPSFVGSVRGRAGYLVEPNLQIYGTAGSAFGGQK
ncbi:MAG: outer membrane protein [Methylocystis sp.]